MSPCSSQYLSQVPAFDGGEIVVAVVVATFHDQTPAPRIRSVSAVATTKTTVQSRVILTSDGVVYCSESSSGPPPSISGIIFQNNRNVSNGNETTLSFRSLIPSTSNYLISCATISEDNVQLVAFGRSHFLWCFHCNLVLQGYPCVIFNAISLRINPLLWDKLR